MVGSKVELLRCSRQSPGRSHVTLKTSSPPPHKSVAVFETLALRYARKWQNAINDLFSRCDCSARLPMFL